MSITENNLFITEVINVIKSNNENCHKLLHNKSRHGDAFVYIISGSCTYTFDDVHSFTAQKGDVLYLPNRSNYTLYIHSSDYHFIFCDFRFGGEEERRSEIYSPIIPTYAENLFYKLLQCHSSHSQNAFFDTMAILYGIYALFRSTKGKGGRRNASKDRIVAAKEFIDSNFKEPFLGVSFLAEKAGMSEVNFRRLFKEEYSISPSQYIITLRIKKAQELMNYPFLTLEQCALQSGFSSLQYFCRTFKNITGKTPSAYRKKKQE